MNLELLVFSKEMIKMENEGIINSRLERHWDVRYLTTAIEKTIKKKENGSDRSIPKQINKPIKFEREQRISKPKKEKKVRYLQKTKSDNTRMWDELDFCIGKTNNMQSLDTGPCGFYKSYRGREEVSSRA